ncbi:hypothetical protein OF83DRAFT_1192588 [Amylostereum chailletii]|nr:hypothetical protein OF83DRAFT_1192588 [Amylostereum chailletii]
MPSAPRFEALDRLGSLFCFDRNFQGDRHPESVFSTMAWNLACWDPGFKRALADVISRRGSLADTTDIISQWEHLIVEPAKDLTVAGPVLLVVDALDESGDNSSRRLLISFLTTRVADLPPNFRIIVTSRPEPDVMSAIRKQQDTLVHCIDLEAQGAEAKEDVLVYIRHRFALADGHLDDAHQRLLAEKSEGLFQWAFTACEVVLGPRTAGLTLLESVDDLLQSIKPTGLVPLDALYSGVLAQAFSQDNERVMSRFRSVMAQVLSTLEPLSANSLHDIRRCWSGDPEDEITIIIPHLGAVLSGVTDRSAPVRPFHTSFRDFLTTQARSGIWHIDQQEGNPIMGLGCVRLMNMHLRFNICQLETSYIPNKDVSNLADRLNKYVSPALHYAVLYWKDHLGFSLGDSDLQDAVERFLYDKLLFWFEVLSLLGKVNQAARALHTAMNLFHPFRILKRQLS